MAERRIEYMPVAGLVPAPVNPKRHDAASLRASLGRFGYAEPVLLDERTGRLVAGHGRVESLVAAEAEGLEPPEGVTVGEDGRWLAPVVRGWSSADDAEAAAYLVASNRISEAGGWNDRSLAELLEGLHATAEAGLSGTGYDDAELGALLASLAEPVAPAEFPEVGDDLPTDYRCPRCAYEWSGKPA